MMVVATVLFGLAVMHTFMVAQFARLASRYPKGSLQENFFQLLSEVEIVFGFWAGVYVLILAFSTSPAEAVRYVETRSYNEPIFVFVIMAVCATRPILNLTVRLMDALTDVVARTLTMLGRNVGPPLRDVISFTVIMVV